MFQHQGKFELSTLAKLFNCLLYFNQVFTVYRLFTCDNWPKFVMLKNGSIPNLAVVLVVVAGCYL